MAKCKVGDRALIVRVDSDDPTSYWARQDLGKVVHVVSDGDDWSDYGDCRTHWGCRLETGGLLAVVDVDDGSIRYEGLADIPDENLLPLRDYRPDEVDEMVKRVGKPEAREVTA